MAYFRGIFFANRGGGGGQNYFQFGPLSLQLWVVLLFCEATLAHRLQLLSPRDFEGLLHPVFQEDLLSMQREGRERLGLSLHRHVLRVVFPPRGPGKPPGRKSPKNGENLQNSPPRSDPQKWGTNHRKNYKNSIFGVIFPLFGANFPHFRGSDRGGEICNFSDFRPGGLSGPSKEENNPQDM